MAAEKIGEQAVKDSLTVTKGADRQNELGKKGHPQDEKKRKDTG
jgi:hypothetical protein